MTLSSLSLFSLYCPKCVSSLFSKSHKHSKKYRQRSEKLIHFYCLKSVSEVTHEERESLSVLQPRRPHPYRPQAIIGINAENRIHRIHW